jgi:hypothetical protein
MNRYPRTPTIPVRPGRQVKDRHRPMPVATTCDRCERPGAEFRWIGDTPPANAKRRVFKLCRFCTESLLDFIGQSVTGPRLPDETPDSDRSVPPWISPVSSGETPAG